MKCSYVLKSFIREKENRLIVKEFCEIQLLIVRGKRMDEKKMPGYGPPPPGSWEIFQIPFSSVQ
ncbi:UNVERIFIED_CONTAM: hypothetical protein NCL1_44755 [Trichonephila clavipes]